ncbi:hypothetical protein P153DRAFT_303608, partial [Dothidotthia symphoricarpi CBS 119687]
LPNESVCSTISHVANFIEHSFLVSRGTSERFQTTVTDISKGILKEHSHAIYKPLGLHFLPLLDTSADDSVYVDHYNDSLASYRVLSRALDARICALYLCVEAS